MRWDEAADDYTNYLLRISEAESLEINLTGVLSTQDFRDLEIARFDYEIGPIGRISGRIGILPGRAGYWTISFANAKWSLEAA